MKHSTRILTLLLAALSVAAFAQDASPLKRAPKVGDVSKYKLDATITLSIGEGTFAATMAQKVIKVGDDGTYVVEEKTSGKATFAGTDYPVPDSTEKQTRNAQNLLTAVEGDEIDATKKEGEFRMDALQTFHAPATAVKVGDTWSFDQKASSATSDVGTKVDYKVEGAEDLGGHKAFKIHATGKESGGGDATADMTFWVDRTSGAVVKCEGTLKHAVIGGAPEPIDMKFTMTLVE